MNHQEAMELVAKDAPTTVTISGQVTGWHVIFCGGVPEVTLTVTTSTGDQIDVAYYDVQVAE